MRARFLRWLLGWCTYHECDCNLNAGEMKCQDSVYDRFLRFLDREAAK